MFFPADKLLANLKIYLFSSYLPMRNYKKKRMSQKKKRIPQDRLDLAMRMIRENNSSIRAAAKAGGFSEAALRKIIKKQETQDLNEVATLVASPAPGKQRAIPDNEERSLAAAIRLRAKWGFGLTRRNIQNLVAEFVTTNKEKETPLGDYLRKFCDFKVSLDGFFCQFLLLFLLLFIVRVSLVRFIIYLIPNNYFLIARDYFIS